MSDTNAVDEVHGDADQGGVMTGGAGEGSASGTDLHTQPAGRPVGPGNEADPAADDELAGALDEDDLDDDLESEDDESDPDDDEAAVADGDTATPSGSGRRRGTSIRRLEEEGEVAADYLEELLDIVDLDGDIDIDVENGRASVAVVAENGVERELKTLVGARGEVLEALQELSRLAVQARTGERSRLMLDIAGFRAARRRSLEDLAARAVNEVRRSGDPVRLEPMSAFERKVVHDAVADAGLVSESEGEEPGRRVVVRPAGA